MTTQATTIRESKGGLRSLMAATAFTAVALAGAALTAVIASSAFLEAWHRPSDMVAAVAVAAGWGFLAAPFVQREDGDDEEDEDSNGKSGLTF